MKLMQYITLQRSIFIKFVLSFIVVGLVPLAALGYLLLNEFSTQSGRFNDNNLKQMTLFIAKNTDQLFAAYNNTSKLMYGETWYERLRDAANANQISVIDDLLESILSSDKYIENVYFIPQTSGEINFKSKKAKLFDITKFPLEPMTAKLKSNPKGFAFYATHPESYFNQSELKVMTLSRNLLETSSVLKDKPTIIGTLIFDVNIAVFENIFAQIELSPEDEIQLIDQGNVIVYSNHKERIGKSTTQQDAQKINKKTDRIVTYVIEVTQQVLIGRFSSKDFFSTFTQFKGFIISIAAVSLIFLSLLALVFSRRFSRPIRDVIHQMSRMESGNLDVQLPVKSEDELGQLIRGMNRMAIQLGQFIKEAYVAQIQQKQSELNALKSQIRPHYLYNTLEVIRMSAVSNDDVPVANMIHSLSNQLEYVLDYGENIVTLNEEIRNLEDYFHLIQVRYEDRVNLTMRIDSDVSLDWAILKLSIQPLVENALQHGILPKDDGGNIGLEIIQDAGEVLSIRIIDDGVGMDEDKIRELTTLLTAKVPDRAAKHLGLKNVHDRLQSLFGESYGIVINSIPFVGTSVQFRIPIVKELDSYVKRIAGG